MKYFQSKPARRQLFWLVLLGLGLYALVPQLGGLGNSLRSLSQANFLDGMFALCAWLVTILAAAAVYYFLALRPLPYGVTALVALASSFSNRLLPAGAGGISTYYVYLRRRHHSRAAAITVIAVTNLLGVVGHATLLLLLARQFSLPVKIPAGWGLGVSVLIGAAAAIAISQRAWRHKFGAAVRPVVANLSLYRRRLSRLVLAYGSSLLLTLANIACLYYCLQAVHLVSLSLATVMIIFSAGLLGGSVTPAPGGIGGTEAALLAGLRLYHLPVGPSLAAVFLFRFITYWLALALGALAFGYATKRQYLAT